MQHGPGSAEMWFRRRGLPAVVRRQRSRMLVARTAPGLVGVVLVDMVLITLAVLAPIFDADAVDTDPGLAIGLLALTIGLLLVPVLGVWSLVVGMRRMGTGVQRIVGVVALATLVVLDPVVERVSGVSTFLAAAGINVLIAAVLLLAVRLGLGSILGWALRSAVGQSRAIGQMASRGLPLLMLVVLATFFAAEMWQMAGTLPRWRLWLVVGFLILLTALFLRSVQSDELRGLFDASYLEGDTEDAPLTGTPFADDPDCRAERAHPYTRAELVNVALVLFFARAIQITLFTLLMFVFFVVFGALAVRPETAQAWLGQPTTTGVLFGIPLPVSNELVQVSLFEAMFSGLYFAAAGVTDPQYRTAFYEPLLRDIRISLAAREAYLAGLERTPDP